VNIHENKKARHYRWNLILSSLLLLLTATALSGHILILNNARPSEAIVVWGGDDANYLAGLRLMQSTDAKYMFVCLSQNDFDIESSELQHDREFFARTAGPLAAQIDICSGNSDYVLPEANQKLDAHKVRSVLLVAPQQYSRACYIEVTKQLPNYSWSVSATAEPHFNPSWWRKRGWAKNFFFGLRRLFASLRLSDRPISAPPHS
jgi:hypothetical protein